MNIKRIIDRNGKLIFFGVLIIVCIFLAIKSLNSYYEEDEVRKKLDASRNQVSKDAQSDKIITDYTTESDSIKVTITSFVNYCNNRELENAYKMLTDECKNAMFPTIEDFEGIYINNVYNIQRTFDMTKWSVEGNKSTYLVTLYGDLLATGGNANSTQEYYTFIEDDNGTYKLNINDFIYGENRNLESTVQNITIKIGNVDIYEDHENAEITITNNTSKTICLTGNTYRENIYLQNSNGTTYSSLNSEFDYEKIVMMPNSARTFIVGFNKVYSLINKPGYLILSDVILDYEDYLNSEDKENYSNRTSIQVRYQK